MSSIVTTPFGGGGGDPFQMSVIKEVGLRTGSRVDQIRINGATHGGDGGDDRGSITLGRDEYISRVDIRCAREVDYVKFTTNAGNSVAGGGDGGDPAALWDIRVIAIGGRCADRVDKLDIMYVRDYRPSIVAESNVGFILAYSAPSEEFEEYTSSLYKTVDSYEKVTEHMLSQTYSASVEGEYYVKVAASTEIALTDTSMETVKRELQTELTAGSSRRQKIDSDSVGVKLVNGTLMKDGEKGDQFWMYPTSEPSYSVIKISDVGNVLNHYDLTGELDTQMPGLQAHKVIKNGYVFYGR
jgi:hypothetical protein